MLGGLPLAGPVGSGDNMTQSTQGLARQAVFLSFCAVLFYGKLQPGPTLQ